MLPLQAMVDNWASIYANSAAVRSAVAFAHVGGLVGGGGCAIAADRATLRAYRGGAAALVREIDNLHGIHRVVLWGLALVVISGVLLMLADLEAYLEAPAFWIKMALVVALFLNGALLVRSASRAHDDEEAGRRWLRRASIASLILWFATTLIGAALPNVL